MSQMNDWIKSYIRSALMLSLWQKERKSLNKSLITSFETNIGRNQLNYSIVWVHNIEKNKINYTSNNSKLKL